MTNGSAVVTLSLATTEKWKGADGERKEKTEWHRLVCFNEHICRVIEQYVHKGSKIYAEGAIQTRKWSDKDGVEKFSTEIVIQKFNGQIVLLDGKKGDAPAPRELDDEIPF